MSSTFEESGNYLHKFWNNSSTLSNFWKNFWKNVFKTKTAHNHIVVGKGKIEGIIAWRATVSAVYHDHTNVSTLTVVSVCMHLYTGIVCRAWLMVQNYPFIRMGADRASRHSQTFWRVRFITRKNALDKPNAIAKHSIFCRLISFELSDRSRRGEKIRRWKFVAFEVERSPCRNAFCSLFTQRYILSTDEQTASRCVQN